MLHVTCSSCMFHTPGHHREEMGGPHYMVVRGDGKTTLHVRDGEGLGGPHYVRG